MGDTRGFLKVERKAAQYRPVCERLKDFSQVSLSCDSRHSQEQASRCMDCGTPFCHWACPLGNYIPEWNDFLFRGEWRKAFQLLEATHNFPEITGRICPATCEYSCVLGINSDAVTIRENELAIIEYAFKNGMVKPRRVKRRSGKRIAIVGSGPAGLACADQLNSAGHRAVVFERDYKIGGILRYGIPDFKLEKGILDRRLEILEKEGIEFKTNVDVGGGFSARELLHEFDAACFACGSRLPRDLKIEGRDLEGIYFAMDYLVQANRVASGERIDPKVRIDAKGKKVVVIGGGDTGADCLGVALRQGASCVVQIELLARPPECRTPDFSWPTYPMLLKTSSSHQEGGTREWSVLTKKFIGENGKIKKLACVKVDFKKDASGCLGMREVPGSEFQIEADLVILALGFLHPEHRGPIGDLGLQLDGRGNVRTGPDFMSSTKGVFSCGDMHRGQSLVVWAVAEGRQAAYHIDRYLTGESFLPLI
jgi:glutamate synthase (NADPH/NADH) small chain